MMEVEIRRIDGRDVFDAWEDMTALLCACVETGASVGFVLPFSSSQSAHFWRAKVFPTVAAGERVLWGAFVGMVLVGTVGLVVEQLPNQYHRAEVSKLLVHPEYRRQGIARKLMEVLELYAHSISKRLLTLDTKSGDSAEPLYLSMGFQIAGLIRGYCRSATGGTYDSTTYMYKTLVEN